MLLRYQCIIPFQMGDVMPNQTVSERELEQKNNEYIQKRLIENFQIADSLYPFIKRAVSCSIMDEDGELELRDATTVFEFLNYTIKDTGTGLDSSICIFNLFFYGSNPEELYALLDSHDWEVKTEQIYLDVRTATLKIKDYTLPCTVTDLNAPAGFEHPLILDCINNRGKPFELFSNRELLNLALTFTPSFYENVITQDYIRKAQQTIVNRGVMSQDDLSILENEFNFIKDGENDFTWSNH